MNNGAALFLGLLFAMACSWFAFVGAPQWQFGQEIPYTDEATGKVFPVDRGGAAKRGHDVYRQNGCFECHTQQVRQQSYRFSLVVDEWGTNVQQTLREFPEVSLVVSNEEVALPPVPYLLFDDLTLREAKDYQRRRTESGTQLRRVNHPVGPDIARWGARRTVGLDYLLDRPVMLGDRRFGPDLSNIGNRQPDPRLLLLQLYQPRLRNEDSVMPSYPFLFESMEATEENEAEALRHQGEFVKDSRGRLIAPKPEAHDLAAYLLSLRLDEPVFEAPGLGIEASAPESEATEEQSD